MGTLQNIHIPLGRGFRLIFLPCPLRCGWRRDNGLYSQSIFGWSLWWFNEQLVFTGVEIFFDEQYECDAVSTLFDTISGALTIFREPCKIADGLDCRFHNPRFSMVFSSPDNVNLEFF